MITLSLRKLSKQQQVVFTRILFILQIKHLYESNTMNLNLSKFIIISDIISLMQFKFPITL